MPAYAELMRTVDLHPKIFKRASTSATFWLAGKQTARAVDQANAILAIDPNNADAHALLSGVAISNGDRAEALVQIQRALAIDPNRASFHASLGFLQSTDPATAVAGEDQLRKAVSLDNKNVTAHLVLASLLQRKGDFQGAQDEMKAAIAADPKNIVARASLAELYLHQNDTAKGEEILRQTAEDLSDSEGGAGMLATYYIRTNQLVPGAAAYADLVAKHPKSTPLKVAYLRLLILNKDIPKARTIAADLAKADPNVPEVAVLNGMILLNDGKTNEAFTELQKAPRPILTTSSSRSGSAAPHSPKATLQSPSRASVMRSSSTPEVSKRSQASPKSLSTRVIQRPRTNSQRRHRDQSAVCECLHLARYGRGQPEVLR